MTYKIELGGKPCPWLQELTAEEVQGEVDALEAGQAYRVFEEEAQPDELLGSIFPDVTVQFPRKPQEAAAPQTKQPQTYTVQWEITIDADSAQDAARQAWEVMRRPDSMANVFDVTGEDGKTVRVDLQAVGVVAEVGA